MWIDGCRERIHPRRSAFVALLAASLATSLLAGAVPATAQDTPPDAPAAAAAGREPAAVATAARRDRTRSTDPHTPRGAAYAFLDACREGDFEKAATFLDLSHRQPRRAGDGPSLARRLMVVMDRKVWADFMDLANRPDGDPDDGVAGVDVVGTVKGSARGDIDIELERVPDEGGQPVWKFSAATVAAIPELYDQFGYGWVGEVLPSSFFTVSFLQIELWQWIGLVGLIVAAWFLAWIAARLLVRLLRPVAARTQTDIDDRIVALMASPVRLVITVALFTAGGAALGLRKPVQAFLANLEMAAIVVAVTWFVLRLVDVLAEVVADRLHRTDRSDVTTVVPLGRRALKVVIFILALLAMLQNLGFNVTGLVAGLGVGGLAFALAAQKSIENLFGGVTLIADQPVRVGDFCRFGDQIGTVEDVGLRSTRIRTLDRTLISIPNADFSQMAIENFAKRDRVRLVATLGLRYETTPDQLRFVLATLRAMLHAHPRVLADPCRVRLIGFGASSLDLEVFAYVDTTDFNEFLAIREDIYLRIMDIIEEAGTGFAFPSQTIYTARDGGLDGERGRAAEKAVDGWRRDGSLPFPFFGEERIADLRGTLDYPPKGSASTGGGEDDGT